MELKYSASEVERLRESLRHMQGRLDQMGRSLEQVKAERNALQKEIVILKRERKIHGSKA
jgi:uncharacterized protein (DUF3084 family)